MLGRLHEFLVRQLGDSVRALRTIESGPHRLVVEATTPDGSAYIAKAAAAAAVGVEIDALLAAETIGLPHGGLSGYELADGGDISLILTRALAGVPATEAASALSSAAVDQLVQSLALMHSRAVSGWGPLDSAASRRARAPVGSFETWRASATYGLDDALRRIDAAQVLQPDVRAALRDALGLTPDEPTTGPRWLHGNVCAADVVVSPDASAFVGFRSLATTECGDPARDLARWVLRDGAAAAAPALAAYGALTEKALDPWRVWWWALIDAVRALDRSIAVGPLSTQLDMPVRIVDLLDEAGIRERPSSATA